jgi:RND family efflux transporter MFP subunit
MFSAVSRIHPFGAIAVAVLLPLAGCHKPAPVTDSLARVAYFTAAPAAPKKASYIGVVRARTESRLGFRVPGKVMERLVDPGDEVKAGQALMKLDASDYRLALNASRAAVKAALARQVQASADERRMRALLATGAVSRQAYEQVKALADADTAQVDAERARARQAEHQAEYAVLRADQDGIVMEVPVEPGEVVAAGQAVVKLARNGTREAQVNIPEQALVLTAQSASASLYLRPSERFPAVLRELSAVADVATRTYQARYTLSGAAAQAPLGATVTVTLDGDPGALEAISVPVGSVIDKGQGPSVWVIDPTTSTVKLQPVEVEALGEERVRIVSGISPGERVVAFGAHLLKAGQKVELFPAGNTGSGT